MTVDNQPYLTAFRGFSQASVDTDISKVDLCSFSSLSSQGQKIRRKSLCRVIYWRVLLQHSHGCSNVHGTCASISSHIWNKAFSFLSHLFHSCKFLFLVARNVYEVSLKASFEVLTPVAMPCSPVEVNQRFRGPCCLHHQGDYEMIKCR
jgi:hypothetical protein